MNNLSLSLLLASSLMISGASFAQTTSETEAEATPETQVDETFPVASENSEPVDGQMYISESHGDWEIRCVKGQEDDTCRLFQILTDGEGNSVAEFNLVSLPDASKARGGVTFITPLGTLLTAQVGMRVDAGKAKKYEYSWCTQVGCVSRFGLTGGEIDAMKRGAKATMSITPVAAPDKPIALDLSLSGFTAAWDALSK